MTCKECYHNEACGGFLPSDLDKDVWDLCAKGKSDEIPDIEDRCSKFKDKTLIIELPCKVGDTVYIPYKACDGKGCPYNGSWDRNWRCMYKSKDRCEPFVDEKSFDLTMLSDIGKTVFLSREKAEKKLKRKKVKK